MSRIFNVQSTRIFNAGVNPSGLALSPNERYLFVANNNNYDLPGEDIVSIFDLKYGNLIKNVTHPSFNEPYTVTIDQAKELAYVCNSGSPAKDETDGTITMVSLKTHKVTGVIKDKRLDGPSGMVIINGYGYVNNYGAAGGVGSGNGKSITVIDLVNDKVVGSIPTSLAPAALTNHGKYLAVACYTSGEPNQGIINLFKVNGAKYRLVKDFKGLFGPFAIEFSANGEYLYATNFGSNNFSPFGRSLWIGSISSGEVNQVDVGVQPSGLAVTPDGKTIIVSCYNTLYSDITNYTGLTAGQGTLVYVNAKTLKVIKTIKCAKSPANLVISADGRYTYVSCYTGGVVEEIEN